MALRAGLPDSGATAMDPLQVAAHAQALAQQAAQHDEASMQQLSSICQACRNLTQHLPLADLKEGAGQEQVAAYLHNAMQLTQACLGAGGAFIDNATEWCGQSAGARACGSAASLSAHAVPAGADCLPWFRGTCNLSGM